ncbi:site-specific integrase [Desulfofalx alkaliphila]|uniref:site-specific integrase n=1 Tax=Desulfofalx alkaliphila TaxID=105483 RepID=UPI0004E0D416|nr:site-specific integrase [Desulfofalx alkaliphila]
MASVQNKGPNKWLLVVSDGFHANGKRKRHTKAFQGTEKQAIKAAILFEEDIKQGKYCAASKDFTFAEFVELWEKDYGDRHLAPKTLARYKEMLNSRILPLIGHLRMDKIRPMTINRLINDLEDSPRLDGKPGKLAAQTIKHHFRCVSAILQDAVEWDVIPDNPCSRVKPPRVKITQAKCYSENQVEEMLKFLKKEPLKHQTLIYLAIASGARQGEIMGLEWRHIDFDDNTIKIEQSSQYLPGKGVFTKEPKNEASKRTISMPGNVMELLRAYRAEWLSHRLRLGDMWQGSERLFTTWDGRPGYPQWPGQWFNKFLAKNNLPHVPFHSLRHLSATLLIKEGVPLKNISKRLGHTVYGTTADIYSHALESVDRVAAEKFEKLLTGGLVEKTDRKHG